MNAEIKTVPTIINAVSTAGKNDGTTAVPVKVYRGRLFQKGNPGRPKGSKNKATIAAEALLEGEAANLARKCIDMAMDGDVIALKLALDRVLSPKKSRKIQLPDLPEITDAQSLSDAFNVVTTAVRNGDLDAEAADSVVKLLTAFGGALSLADVERRLLRLERGKS